MASYRKTRAKLNRAIAAYLVSVGAGSQLDTTAANIGQPKGYPNTTVRSTLSNPEIQLSGIRRITVHISIKGSAVIGTGETNPDVARVNFDDRVSKVSDALMMGDDGQTLKYTAAQITAAGRALAASVIPGNAASDLVAANNADMADFTCQEWFDMGEGDGEANAEGCDWEEILIFEAVCSDKNVD